MATVQAAYGTRANWLSSNRTPVLGEVCIETDSGRIKFGDGATAYQSLKYLQNLTLPDYAVGASPASYFDSSRGVYNLKSSNTRLIDQGRSDCMTNGISQHLFIGDSVGAGATSGVGVITYDRLRAPILAFRDQLANMGVPANGTGFIRINDAGQFDSRWTTVAPTGTWVATTGIRPYICSVATTVATATCTPDRSCETGKAVVDIWYQDDGAATVSVAIDGATTGANFAGITTGAGAAGTGAWKKFRMYGATVRMTSRIVVSVSIPGSGFALAGISIWQPNAGVVVNNVSQSGSAASIYSPKVAGNEWADTSLAGPMAAMKGVAGSRTIITDARTSVGNAWIDSASSSFAATGDTLFGEPVDQFPDIDGAAFPPNTYITGRASATRLTTSNAALVSWTTNKTVNIGRAPHCIHIELGGNDTMDGVVTMATLKAAITTIRNTFPNSDCVLHLVNEPTRSLATTGEEAAFQIAMYQVADALDVPMQDWRDRAGTYEQAFANGMFQDYQAHMIPGAYAELGSSLAQVFGGGSGLPMNWTVPTQDGHLANKKYVDDIAGRISTVAALATVTTTVETVVMKVLIPAGTLRAGLSTIDYELGMHPAATTITTTRIRIGTTGTTADAAVVAMSATALTNAATRYCKGIAGIQVAGASATVLGVGTEMVGATIATGTASATSGTFDSAKENYVSVTVQNTSSTTTTVYGGKLVVNV